MRSVLLLRLDGMGDIILFEPVLRALRRAWPEARLTVVVRAEYVELGPLLSPEINWVGTTIDPIRLGPAEAETQLAELRQVIGSLQPDIVVACTSRRNWLDTAVASMVPGARRIAFEDGGEDAYFGPQLRSLYPAISGSGFSELAMAGDEEQEWRRNAGLAGQILGQPTGLDEPRIASGPRWEAAANPVLRGWGLEPGSYVVCAAAGFANVPIKTWPAARYIAVLQWLRSTHGLSAILVGGETEAGYLAEIARETGAKVWTPGAGGWPELAALLRHSRLCLGNDTGVLHLTSAVARPVVGVFGGGTWPRFIPAGPGAVVVNPLPCFGCGWDCVFGDAPCVKIIAPEPVQTVLTAVLERKAEGECAVEETHHFLPETAGLMGIAARRWRERASALDQRERQFQETVRLAAEKDGEIWLLKDAANVKDTEIQLLKRETDGKDEEIAALKASADERDQAAIESAAEAERIREVAEVRAAEIEKLHRACAELQKACDERLALIVRLDREVKALANRGNGPA